MPSGAVRLRDYPDDQVRVACQPYGREGRYSRTLLIRQHGAYIGLPELLARITADCPKCQDWRQHGPCRARYLNLGAVRRSGAK